MRIYLKITENTSIVPFDYQHLLLGTFHKWLGNNELHDEISLYSFGWLSGAEMSKEGFNFKQSAGWFISFVNPSVGEKLIFAIREMPELFNGMEVREIFIEREPQFGNEERFQLDSPILIRDYIMTNDKRRAVHLKYDDKKADELMTATLNRKLKKAGLNYSAQVMFDRNYRNAKTKLVTINGIKNKANFCPVIIKGTPEAIAFAWNVGIGHSTGSGFGALK